MTANTNTTNLIPGQLLEQGDLYDWVAKTLESPNGVEWVCNNRTDWDSGLTEILTHPDDSDMFREHQGGLYYLFMENDGFELYYVGKSADALKLRLHPGLFPGVQCKSDKLELMAALKKILDRRLFGTRFSVEITSDPNAHIFSVDWWQDNWFLKGMLNDAIIEANASVDISGTVAYFHNGTF